MIDRLKIGMTTVEIAIREKRFFLTKPEKPVRFLVYHEPGLATTDMIRLGSLFDAAVAAGKEIAYKQVDDIVMDGLKPLKTKINALEISLETMTTWMNDSGIITDFSTPVPTIINTRAEELLAMLRVAAERAYQDEIVDTDSEEDKIGEWKEYADREDWIESWIEDLKPKPE